MRPRTLNAPARQGKVSLRLRLRQRLALLAALFGASLGASAGMAATPPEQGVQPIRGATVPQRIEAIRSELRHESRGPLERRPGTGRFVQWYNWNNWRNGWQNWGNGWRNW